jgi:uncharacterized protein (TIGR04255 family)
MGVGAAQISGYSTRESGKFLESLLRGAAVFSLDSVRRYRLGRAPLVQALVQVRFPLIAHLQTLAGVAPLQERLRDMFPYMEERKEVALIIGPPDASPSESEKTTSWQFTDDLGWQLTISSGVANLLASSNYTGFDEFANRFRTILEVLRNVERMSRCDRLGVRYLNIAGLPNDDPNAWSRWFRSELVGWPGSGLLAPDSKLVVSITQSQLTSPPVENYSSMPAEVQAIIRHGVAPAGSGVPGLEPQLERDSFLLDLDLFVLGAQPFDPPALHEQFTILHSQIDRFFRWSLTDEGAEHFQLKEIE